MQSLKLKDKAMFWTDNQIQTSFSIQEILLAVAIFIAAVLFYLIRTRKARRAATGGRPFIWNFVKLFSIPFIIAIIYIFFDSHQLAVLIYDEDQVAKSEYVAEDHKVQTKVLISQVSGPNVYQWDGQYLREVSGKIIIQYKDQRFLTSAGKPLLQWKEGYVESVTGQHLYQFEAGILSKVSGPNLYQFELDYISELSGKNILKVDQPYDIPKPVLIFAVLHYNGKL